MQRLVSLQGEGNSDTEDTRGEGAVGGRGQTAMVQISPRSTKDCWELPESRGGAWNRFSREPSEGTSAADMLTSHF